MPISIITNLRKISQFPSQYGGPDGMMHKQEIAFQDGMVGTANTKSPVPSYKIGDQMEYTVTGQYNNMNELKVKKPNQQFNAPAAPAAPAAAPYGAPPAAPPAAAPYAPPAPAAPPQYVEDPKEIGQMVGAAVNNAYRGYLEGKHPKDEVAREANALCNMAKRLKAVHVANHGTVPFESTGLAKAAPAAPPPPAPVQQFTPPVTNAAGAPVNTQPAEPVAPVNQPVQVEDDEIPF